MHLRGPMNISQLAVYQLPSDMHTLGKRSTVPFYNRRRATNKRDHDSTSDALSDTDQGSSLERRTFNTCGPRTVTTTVTVTECTSTFAASTIQLLPDTTYIGPALPCMPTPTLSGPGSGISRADCTCDSSTSPSVIPELDLPAFRPFPGVQRRSMIETSEVVRRDAGDWSRVAYYTSAAPSQATGFSFLGNQGDPEKSGTFD
jgi:hypothetical protein